MNKIEYDGVDYDSILNSMKISESPKNINCPFTFTEDQEKAINSILDFINEDWDDNKVAIGLYGPGGTGKTFITNHIINNCKFSHSVVCCTAPTHKACRVLSNALEGRAVTTIQAAFGFKLDVDLETFDPNNLKFKPMGKVKVLGSKVLIVDESSMLNRALVDYIYNLCKKNKIKVLFQGDDKQLAPVKEKISSAPKKCFKINQLNQIVRQKHNNSILELTTALRSDINNKTFTFYDIITKMKGVPNFNELNEGYYVCGINDFQTQIDNSFSDNEYLSNINLYKVVGYTNVCVNGWNNYIRKKIIPNADVSIISKHDLLMGYDTILNRFQDSILINSEEYIVHDVVDNTEPRFELKGFLVKLQMIHSGKITPPIFIIDHNDKYTLKKYVTVLNEIVTKAKRTKNGSDWKAYFDFKRDFVLAANILNPNRSVAHNRQIDYGFAITSHKSQGSTYNTVFVDVNNMTYTNKGTIYPDREDLLRRLYVACSRAKSKLILCWGE